MRILSYIFLLLIIILGVTFATLNSEMVAINYYIGHRTMPLSLLLVIVFTTGCVLGMLVASWLLFKMKMQNHALRKRLKLVDKEIENLRAIPLKDTH
jgi:putative membrane protein